jgi:hypothetical protein
MKTPEQISTKIQENVENMIKFPKMWFDAPESMELHLMFLTNLLSFIHGQPDGQYTDYLVAKGYQSNNFTNSLKENGHNDADKVFSLYSGFFKEFFDTFKSDLDK